MNAHEKIVNVTPPVKVDCNGKAYFNKEKQKFIIEFDFPECKAKVENIHIADFTQRNNNLKIIGNRIYEAFELIGREFYTENSADIRLRKAEYATMTVKIIL